MGMKNAIKTAYLKALVDAIRDNYGCSSLHNGSDLVQIRLGEKFITLQVELFQLINCPDASKCFAWIHPPQAPGQNITFAGILAGPGVSSAKEAVHAYIAGYDQEREAA